MEGGDKAKQLPARFNWMDVEYIGDFFFFLFDLTVIEEGDRN